MHALRTLYGVFVFVFAGALTGFAQSAQPWFIASASLSTPQLSVRPAAKSAAARPPPELFGAPRLTFRQELYLDFWVKSAHDRQLRDIDPRLVVSRFSPTLARLMVWQGIRFRNWGGEAAR